MKKQILLSTITQITLLFFIITCASCQQQPSKTGDEKTELLLNEVLKIWNKGDLAKVDEVYSPNLLYHHLNIYEDRKGIDAFKDFVVNIRTIYPDFFVAFENNFSHEEWATAQWTIIGTNTGPRGDLPPTGKKVKFSGVTIYQIKEGKIVEEWTYYNQGDVLKQLGFILVPPSIESHE